MPFFLCVLFEVFSIEIAVKQLLAKWQNRRIEDIIIRIIIHIVQSDNKSVGLARLS